MCGLKSRFGGRGSSQAAYPPLPPPPLLRSIELRGAQKRLFLVPSLHAPCRFGVRGDRRPIQFDGGALRFDPSRRKGTAPLYLIATMHRPPCRLYGAPLWSDLRARRRHRASASSKYFGLSRGCAQPKLAYRSFPLLLRMGSSFFLCRAMRPKFFMCLS